MKIYIYSFINKFNGHRYIGKTNNIERRKREHKSIANNPKIIKDHDTLWYKKLRQYGFENFDFEILEITNENDWAKREQYWIAYYNTYKGAGYNTTPGGDDDGEHLCSLTKDDAQEIHMLLLNSSMTQDQIAAQYNISQTLLSNINLGLKYANESLQYPLRKNYKNGLEDYGELIHLLQHSILSFREIALKLNMCEASVKKINYGKMQKDDSILYPIRKFDTRSIKLIQKELLNTDLSIEEIAYKHNKTTKYVNKVNNGEVLYNSILQNIYSYPLRK